MKLDLLNPFPNQRDAFSRSAVKFIPVYSGCYALATFDGIVLYVGLASNLKERFTQHLDTPVKVEETKLGRASVFHWFQTTDLNRVERTWLNIHVHHEGCYPVLNTLYSPT